eukprot:gnl/Chilomastix_caulleri/2842.p1 GENE.gnl/Chilomastix_caulleri/2842~~gnl/Chilomastix_caulleri/2842.p1  ORF type:complete len:88 (+),score=30.85 gnl/Chilomastix_caulleri/2842:144-407(+)
MYGIWHVIQYGRAVGVVDLLAKVLDHIMDGKELVAAGVPAGDIPLIAAQLSARFMRAERMIVDGASDLVVLSDALNFTAFSIGKHIV